MTRSAFAQALPDAYYLDPADWDGLPAFLHDQGWLTADESIREVTRAGDGNMNCAVRVTTTATSFILKQSRPWVEKYPEIAAPVERALREGAFYQLVSAHRDIARMMPRLLGFSRQAAMLQLEDLGLAADYTWMYRGGTIDHTDFDQLSRYLAALHGAFTGFERKGEFANRAMRELNHEHIFRLPLADNDLDLNGITSGLQSVANELKRDDRYVAEVTRLGSIYLDEGPALLHGDYFPGSWVKVGAAVRVIDPEFCFFGPPEFDVGVMIAHVTLAKQPAGLTAQLFDAYEGDGRLDRDLVARFAGVEMMRRLIGVVQLPLDATLAQKRDWLERSRQMVCAGSPGEGL